MPGNQPTESTPLLRQDSATKTTANNPPTTATSADGPIPPAITTPTPTINTTSANSDTAIVTKILKDHAPEIQGIQAKVAGLIRFKYAIAAEFGVATAMIGGASLLIDHILATWGLIPPYPPADSERIIIANSYISGAAGILVFDIADAIVAMFRRKKTAEEVEAMILEWIRQAEATTPLTPELQQAVSKAVNGPFSWRMYVYFLIAGTAFFGSLSLAAAEQPAIAKALTSTIGSYAILSGARIATALALPAFARAISALGYEIPIYWPFAVLNFGGLVPSGLVNDVITATAANFAENYPLAMIAIAAAATTAGTALAVKATPSVVRYVGKAFSWLGERYCGNRYKQFDPEAQTTCDAASLGNQPKGNNDPGYGGDSDETLALRPAN